MFDWAAPLFELPARLPPSAPSWAGHIPFLFLLFNLARPRYYVELGVMQGTSFFAACEAAKRYETGAHCIGIDTWLGDPHTYHYTDGNAIFDDLKEFLANRYPSAELIRSTFDEASPRFPDQTIDLLHIDGYHTYEAVSHDFAHWQRKLSDHSIVIFHDIVVRKRDFGVWKFWAEIRQKYRFLEFQHSHGLGVLLTGPKTPAGVESLYRRLHAQRENIELFQLMCEAAASTLSLRMQRQNPAGLRDTPQQQPRSQPGPQQELHPQNRPRPNASQSKGNGIIAANHISRNDPCPCGSGKRYKHCHGTLG
jgi:hypothetical protein